VLKGGEIRGGLFWGETTVMEGRIVADDLLGSSGSSDLIGENDLMNWEHSRDLLGGGEARFLDDGCF
jgi:hypothetical protein